MNGINWFFNSLNNYCRITVLYWVLSSVLSKNNKQQLSFVLPILLFIPFPWLERLFTRQVKVQSREKYFNHNNYKGDMPTLAGNKHPFHPFVPS